MSNPRISTSELKKLVGRDKAAISYGGKIYDVTEFLDKHPGGSEQLLLAAGRDVTHFFNSYHSFATRNLVPKRCKLIGFLEETLQESSTESFVGKYSHDDRLYEEIQKRICKYFKDNNLNPHMESSFVLNGVFVIVALLLFWYLAITCYSGGSLVASSIFSLLSGFFSALCLMHLGHDLSHFAFTRKPWVWKWLAQLLSCVSGFSAYVWSYQHVIGHHVHPNHEKLDPDVFAEDSKIYRILSIQPWCPHFLYQHVYMPILYIVISIKIKIMDFEGMYYRKRANVHMNSPDTQQLFLFWMTKFIHMFYRVILPSFYISFPSVVFLNILSEAAGGFWLGFITQLNHINNSIEFPKAPSQMPWSEMQLATTADYATSSKLWTFLSGGLNHQVVHHLFPSILSTYYINLTPIVRATCTEFGIPYICYDDIWSAWTSHLNYLYKMGQEMKKN